MSLFAKSHPAPDNILSVHDLSTDYITALLRKTEQMKDLVKRSGGDDSLRHKVLALFFCEPSTRTSCSFQAAMQRLGGTVISINSTDSSLKKGESVEDTIQTLSCYCDAIAIRHPTKGSAAAAAEIATKPIINAGDGAGEHPTQALLDLFTILSELGRLGGTDSDNPMTVTLLGDLKNGRTVHSLAPLLARFKYVKLVLAAPKGLELPEYIVEDLAKYPDCQVTTGTLNEAITSTDVLYVTRIQKERFASEEEYQSVLGSYCVDAALMQQAKGKMIVMHPLPRLSEIAPEVDHDSRAAYFRQMENGMYLRMALLQTLLLK